MSERFRTNGVISWEDGNALADRQTDYSGTLYLSLAAGDFALLDTRFATSPGTYEDLGLVPILNALYVLASSGSPTWGFAELATGFESSQITATTLAFTDSGPARTFRISSANPTFRYWINGTPYTAVGTGETVQIANSAGIHYIYFDTDANLHETTDPAVAFPKAICAAIYWTGTTHITLEDWRRCITVDWVTNSHNYYANRTHTQFGFDLYGFVADGAGTLNTEAQFGIRTGRLSSLDRTFVYTAATTPASVAIYYVDGSGVWSRDPATTYPIKTRTDGAFQRSLYNSVTAGIGSQVDVQDGSIVAMYLLATPDSTNKFALIQGRQESFTLASTSKTAMQDWREIVSGGVPFSSYTLIGIVLFQSDTVNFSNAVRARVVSPLSASQDNPHYLDTRFVPHATASQTLPHYAIEELGSYSHDASSLLWGSFRSSSLYEDASLPESGGAVAVVSMQDALQRMWSATDIDGLDVTIDNNAGTIAVSAGTVVIRVEPEDPDAYEAPLYSVRVEQGSTFNYEAFTEGDMYYVYVDYSTSPPGVALASYGAMLQDAIWRSRVVLGIFTYTDGDLCGLPLRRQLVDAPAKTWKRTTANCTGGLLAHIRRGGVGDGRLFLPGGAFVLGVLGGDYYAGYEPISVSTMSTAQGWKGYGASAYEDGTALTAKYYDPDTGMLTALGAGEYGVHFAFAVGEYHANSLTWRIHTVFGTASYSDVEDVLMLECPDDMTLPLHLTAEGPSCFIGKVVIQEGVGIVGIYDCEKQFWGSGSGGTPYVPPTTWSGITSTATPAEIFIGGVPSTRLTLAASSMTTFEVICAAYDLQHGKAKRWKIECDAMRDGSSNSALVDDVLYTVLSQSDTPGGGTGTDLWDVAVAVNDTDETFRITVTGAAASRISWKAVAAENIITAGSLPTP